MNIDLAILTFDFAPTIGGVQTYLFEIAQRLGRKYGVCVILPTSGPLDPVLSFQRCLVTSTSALDFRQALARLPAKTHLLGHAHPQLLMAGLLYRKAPYATLTHGNDYLAAQRRWHKSIFNRLLARSQPLITNTHANAHRLEIMGVSRPNVIHPGTDPQRFHPPSTKAAAPPTLLTVGRLVPRKGIDTVLRTLPELLVSYPTLQYHIVGKGPDRDRLEQIAQELAITRAVKFRGQIPESSFRKSTTPPTSL